ncbi:hypothetical protein QUF72_11770 [Desulfobacterales bacterium HSG2]|nr:hypothetical protein [Desulfobacterales bacterium HSG2]
MKFDTVAQWVIALTPPCRACSGAEECGFVTLPLAGPALALRNETGAQCESHPAKVWPAGRKRSPQASPVLFELAEKRESEAGRSEGAGSVLSPEMGNFRQAQIFGKLKYRRT